MIETSEKNIAITAAPEAKSAAAVRHPVWYIGTELIYFAVLLVSSAIITAASEWTFRSGIAPTVSFIANQFLQYREETVFVFLVLVTLFWATRRADAAIFVGGLTFTIASTANYIKVSTRSEPLLPWDLTIIPDASKIISHSKVHITHEVVLSYVFVLICAVAVFFLHRVLKPHRPRLSLRIGVPVALAILATVFTRSVFMSDYFLQKHDIKEITWSQVDNYSQNGFIFSFLNNLSHRKVMIPEDYGSQAVHQAASGIQASPDAAVKPNIILVQSEALCDLTQFKNVKFDQPVMPEIESLRQNSLWGYALTAMFGGGTCNSEFEVMTGFSYSFLPNGSIPYEEYFKRPTFSYASFLKGLGYNTVAVHPFDPTFWDRNIVFPSIGFDKFFSEGNFTNPERKRTFISDMEAMKMVTRQYELNEKTGKPFFNLTVTMQNHFSWGADDYPASERVGVSAPGMTQEEREILSTYATGVRDTDAALKYLVNYFSNVSQPTVILFYGDHLPALDQRTLSAGGYLNGDISDPGNIEKKHATPYVIWNNFKQTGSVRMDMSMYELVPYLDSALGLDRPLYFDFLNDMTKDFRGYATGLYLDSQGNPTTEAPDGADAWRRQQELFQYDLLIGKRYGTELTR